MTSDNNAVRLTHYETHFDMKKDLPIAMRSVAIRFHINENIDGIESMHGGQMMFLKCTAIIDSLNVMRQTSDFVYIQNDYTEMNKLRLINSHTSANRGGSAGKYFVPSV
jgi:hypothetical protein